MVIMGKIYDLVVGREGGRGQAWREILKIVHTPGKILAMSLGSTRVNGVQSHLYLQHNYSPTRKQMLVFTFSNNASRACVVVKVTKPYLQRGNVQ